MKLVYLQQHFAMPDEPGFVRPWQFSKRFAQEGFDVVAIRGGASASDERRDGVKVKTVSANYANEMGFARRLVAFSQYLIKASLHAWGEKADVVYASSGPLTVAVPALIASIRPSTRLVFEVRDLWPDVPVALGILKNPALKRLAKILERLVYGSSDLIVCLSPDMETGVKMVKPNANTVVIPNGCDFDLFEEAGVGANNRRNQLGVDEDQVLVGYAGGFGYMYDLDWPVRLAGRLHALGVRFFFIGHGSESERLFDLADEVGLPQSVFLGLKSKTEVAEYLSSADAILSPLRDHESLEACSLNKVFDAMAAGKPVLFNHGGWLTEAATAARGGWRLSRNLDCAIAEAVSLLDEGKKGELKVAGIRMRQLGLAEFDRDHQFEQLIERVRSVL